jgi:hypothetical protein
MMCFIWYLEKFSNQICKRHSVRFLCSCHSHMISNFNSHLFHCAFKKFNYAKLCPLPKTLCYASMLLQNQIPMLSALTNQPTVKRLLFICPLSISSSRLSYPLLIPCLTKAPTREVLKISRCGPSSGK